MYVLRSKDSISDNMVLYILSTYRHNLFLWLLCIVAQIASEHNNLEINLFCFLATIFSININFGILILQLNGPCVDLFFAIISSICIKVEIVIRALGSKLYEYNWIWIKNILVEIINKVYFVLHNYTVNWLHLVALL